MRSTSLRQSLLWVVDRVGDLLLPSVYSPIGEYLTTPTLMKIVEQRTWVDAHLEEVS